MPKTDDGAVTFRNPAKVEVAPKLVTERLVSVVVPAERVLLIVDEAFDTNPLLKYQDRLSVAVVEAV